MRWVARTCEIYRDLVESDGNVGHFGPPANGQRSFDVLAWGEYASTRKKVKTALWLIWIDDPSSPDAKAAGRRTPPCRADFNAGHDP